MKTKDGIEFKLGMTVYKACGDEIITDPDNWVVESITLDNTPLHLLSRKDSYCDMDIANLYSSRAAIIRDQLRHATSQMRHWVSEIVRLSNLLTQGMA